MFKCNADFDFDFDFEFCYRRISHRTHHQNHGHVENDESWHPVSGFLLLMPFPCFLVMFLLFFSFLFFVFSF